MSHDPEQLAAAYLDGMRARDHHRYEKHLIECEPCWQEVSLGRQGRELAESVRDIAPASLREDIRAVVTAAAAAEYESATSRRRRRHLIVAAAALAAVLVVSVGLGIWRPRQAATPAAVPTAAASPSTLTLAVASFRNDRLPGTVIPDQQAPDLSPLGLHLISAAAGTTGGIDVTAFAYRTDTGTRLDLYHTAQPIPETDEAQELGGQENAWRTEINGITVICGGNAHTELLISTDPILVHQAATLLGAA